MLHRTDCHGRTFSGVIMRKLPEDERRRNYCKKFKKISRRQFQGDWRKINFYELNKRIFEVLVLF
jgi:hypothetical protein